MKETIHDFSELTQHLVGRKERRRVAVACPNDASTPVAIGRAIDEGFVSAILVGCTPEAKAAFAKYENFVEFVDADDADDAARKAVAMVREGRADVLQKGLLTTDCLLRAVLSKETGILPKGNVLTHLACAYVPQLGRMLFMTDVAVIPYPTKEQREQQLRYMLALCRLMGIDCPRVSLISCSEQVNPKHFPVTVDYRELVERAEAGDFGPCIVDGPLDLKTSVSPEALHKKGIPSPLEGMADGLIFPDIQAGNVFYKALTLFATNQTAAILQGAQAPVVLTSRADSAEAKYLSLSLACL